MTHTIELFKVSTCLKEKHFAIPIILPQTDILFGDLERRLFFKILNIKAGAMRVTSLNITIARISLILDYIKSNELSCFSQWDSL
jgi:hypothetical protein